MSLDISHLFNDIEAHAKRELPRESCGLVVVDKQSGAVIYRACRNSAEDPENEFVISPAEYLAAKEGGKYEIAGLIHSHPDGNKKPSKTDRVVAGNNKIASYVYADGELIPVAPETDLPYTGRDFVYGITDCFSIVRDYYKRELGVELEHFFYAPGDEPEHIKECAKRWGFVEVRAPYKAGDIVVMRYLQKDGDHLGIYLGGNVILHHLPRKLSARDSFGRWEHRIVRMLRLENKNNG